MRKSSEKKKENIAAGQKRRRFGWKEWVLLFIPTAAALVAVVLVLYLSGDLLSYKLEGGPCQYYGGGKFRISEGSVLRRTSDEKTLLKEGQSSAELDSLPIYFDSRHAAVLPQNMVYYAPRSGNYGRVDYFTEISADQNGNVQARRKGKEVSLETGFLYDGADFYLFLEPVVVRFNGYRLELPAMSYVEAVYTADVMVFNFGSQDFLFEAPQGAATAEIETGDYTISLLGDSVTRFDGTRVLLFTRPELLDPII